MRKMMKLEYQVRFVTPAFLGNADQNGQWRTPPFKALLRQWWRVAVAPDFRFDHRAIREAEGRLFGHAWLESDEDRRGQPVGGRKSEVRLRLGTWTAGRLTRWNQDPRVKHPEVGNGAEIGSHLYLGYGPLTYDKKVRGTKLKANAAIQAGEQARFRMAFPEEHERGLETALRLMHLYGAAGGRSRNGWGSFVLTPLDGTPALAGDLLGFCRPWKDALTLDWPHAVGQDDKGLLVWRTQAFPDWKGLMRELAGIKIGLRTQFTFKTGRNAHRPEPRHWLSYPVTNHSVRGWGNNRLPNTLRFKARRDADDGLHGVIFHMPCQPPVDFGPGRRTLESVWERMHRFLDEHGGLRRCRA